MVAKDTHYSGPSVTVSADVVRAAQYNLMIRQLDTALSQETAYLTHRQRSDIYQALDWYRTQHLNLRTDQRGNAMFVDDLPPGRWPVTTMSENAVAAKFERLEALDWLKLPSDMD